MPTHSSQKLQQTLEISPAMAKLLVQRGLDTPDKVHDFFELDLQKLHDPFLMKDMDKAYRLLSQAIEEKQKILLYGDYDVDGTCSVSMFHYFLKDQGIEADYYIPSKFNEGYGLSERGIQYAIDTHTQLIITLDCGIRGHQMIEQAVQAGIQVIVCDHHQVSDTLPPAHAVLNPQRPDCDYPFKGLSGCGVGFKLMHAYAIQNHIPLEDIYQHMDLLAISTCCDIVPMVGENRVLVHHGFTRILDSAKIGVQQLLKMANVEAPIHVSDLVFKVGPRMNAAGRIAHANLIVRLLTEVNEEEVISLVKMIEELNVKRKIYDQECTQEALAMIEKEGEAPAYVLYHPQWHKGVLGIVASRCVEVCGKAVVILTESDGEATGSARAPGGVNLYEALDKSKKWLKKFGGHHSAAGLSLAIKNIDAFSNSLKSAIPEPTSEDNFSEERVDIDLNPEDIDDSLLEMLQKMRPFGPENLEPVFESTSMKAQDIRILKEAHLSFQIQGTPFKTIAFQQSDQLPLIENGQPFRMLFKLNWNFYRGKKLIQLQSLKIRSI